MKCPTKDQLFLDVIGDMTWEQIAEKYGYSNSRFLRRKAKEWRLPTRRIILKPTEEDLRRMVLIEKKTPVEIAEELGYSQGGWSNIYALCRQYGIEFDFSINHTLREVDFTDRQKQIVWGTLLGDGYLRPTSGGKGKSFSLSLCHGEKQLEYLRWLLSEFDNFVVKKEFSKYHPNFHGNAPTYSFNTISHPFLTQARNICYPNGVKDVTEEWIEQLTPLSVAIWYMDDGSLNKRYHTIVLCTNSFSEKGQHLLIEYLDKTFDLSCKLEPRRNNQTVIRINASQSRKFLDGISEYIPDCMKYKLW